MMSGESIRQLSEEAAQRAAKEKREPLMAFTDGDEAVVKCPNLGSYCPKGWELVERLFVDNYGFGDEHDSALTLQQFISKVKEGFGYAIVEEGQFQIYIGVFKKL